MREASPGITEVGRTLIIYAACRAVIIAVVILFPSDVSAAGRFEAFDGSYYANIVQHGYPEVLPIAGQSVIGFFPGYPLVVRAVDGIFRIPTWLGLVSVSLVAGAVATVLMVLIAKELGYASASKGPGVLWQALPVSFLLCVGYSEGLFVALSAMCLLAIIKDRWVVATICAACAGLTHPTGVVFVLVGVIAAFTHQGRGWARTKPLAISAGSLCGLLSFCVYLKLRVGSFVAYFDAKRQGWGNHEDFGEAAVKFVGSTVVNPTLHPWWDIVVASMILVLILLVSMLKTRMPAIFVGYVLGILFFATTFGIASMTSFPRMTFAAFPLFFPLGAWLAKRRKPLMVSWLGACLGLAAVLGVVVTTSRLITP